MIFFIRINHARRELRIQLNKKRRTKYKKFKMYTCFFVKRVRRS